MSQKSEEIKEYKAPDMLEAFKQAFIQMIEGGSFLPRDSFEVNLIKLERIVFDTEDLQERAKLYTYVMNNARAVDMASLTEECFRKEAANHLQMRLKVSQRVKTLM